MDYRESTEEMYVEIDSQSGFCHGVVNAITKAEQALASHKHLYCLGDIVHNTNEVDRLQGIGLSTIDTGVFKNLSNSIVLLRAHGEPPSTYEEARQRNITIIDATCPVVLRLQQRVKAAHEEMKAVNGQVVIYGKHGHAEVVGLLGQTGNTAIVISSRDEMNKVDLSRPIAMFSQTTQNIEKYHLLAKEMEQIIAGKVSFRWHDTICRQVANRDGHLREFARIFDVIVFVSDKKSSNGAYLYSICKQENAQTYFISSPSELQSSWFTSESKVGISGATSTPKWLMENVQTAIYDLV